MQSKMIDIMTDAVWIEFKTRSDGTKKYTVLNTRALVIDIQVCKANYNNNSLIYCNIKYLFIYLNIIQGWIVTFLIIQIKKF